MDEQLEPRLAAIDRTGLVDGPPDDAFDRAARLASSLLGTTVVHTTLVLGDRQFYPSHRGLPEPIASARETTLDYSFCKHVVADEAPVRFDDTRDAPRLADNRAVAEFDVRTYVGVPLRSPDGTVIGTVCALDFAERHWTDEEVLLLEDVADMLRTELTLREEVRRLRHLQEQRLVVGLAAARLQAELAELPEDLAGRVDPLVRHLAEVAAPADGD